MKLFISDKYTLTFKIPLEREIVLSLIIKELTNTFNDLFENAANDFGIKGDEHDLDIVISSIFSDLIDFAVTK